MNEIKISPCNSCGTIPLHPIFCTVAAMNPCHGQDGAVLWWKTKVMETVLCINCAREDGYTGGFPMKDGEVVRVGTMPDELIIVDDPSPASA
jgi:Zn ribbon nucleic-acid-binding protein